MSATPSSRSAETMKVLWNVARWFSARAHAVEQGATVIIKPTARIDEHADEARIVRAGPRDRHHRAVEAAARRENPRRVDEHNLRGAPDGDAAPQRPRRLHLVTDDRDLGADERIDEGRFAGIGGADPRDEAAAPFLGRGRGRFRHRRRPPAPPRAPAWPRRRPAPRLVSTGRSPRPGCARTIRPRRGTPGCDPGRTARSRDRTAPACRAPAPTLAATSSGRAAGAAA